MSTYASRASLDLEMQAARQLEHTNHQAIRVIFDNVMRQKTPQDVASRSEFYLRKTIFCLRYMSFQGGLPEISNDRSCLVELANFVGEVRTNMIAGYIVEHKKLNDSVAGFEWCMLGTNSQHITYITPPIKTNSQEQLVIATNTFQGLLQEANIVLTPYLLKYSAEFHSTYPTDSNFLGQISVGACLTGEEQKKLHRVKTD